MSETLPVPTINPDGLYTMDAVAALFDRHPKTVAKWPIPWSYAGDKTKRILGRELQRWLVGRAVAA
jgi:hypothetical protein